MTLFSIYQILDLLLHNIETKIKHQKDLLFSILSAIYTVAMRSIQRLTTGTVRRFIVHTKPKESVRK